MREAPVLCAALLVFGVWLAVVLGVVEIVPSVRFGLQVLPAGGAP